MSFLATFGAAWTKRPRTRAEHAEENAFVSDYQRRTKNRPSQLLLVLAIGATLVGTSLSIVGSYVGFGLLVVGLPATVATGVWCLRNWDY